MMNINNMTLENTVRKLNLAIQKQDCKSDKIIAL